ncbi:hypothetical protein PF010_g21342 [Phytophthora fragariae]|uniref:Uncharacterized protein n=1 Tax=Phytophthora fragariae TaxID=53985 RepID=A0A6G0KBT0_9STRA|nr:hypothetical protein PF010_g21342 [Phytophthora fragariae]
MALSAKETKKRKCDGGQVAPGSHKRKKREAGSAGASAEKTATQGKSATTSPTGKTVRKTGAGKATTCKTASKTGAGKATTGKTASKTGAGKATTGKIVSKTGAGKAMNQDASGEIQEMEMVQSLVEQQAATIASEQPLSIKEVEQAYDALVKMHARWRKGKCQLGRRKKGDFKLSAFQVELIANRYRVAKQTNTTVDCEGASTNKNFHLFNADKLRDQEPYVIAMPRMALEQQRQIDDGNPEKTSDNWADEVVQLKLEHKHEIDAFLQTIRELEGANLRFKAGRPQTSDNSVQASLKQAEGPNSTTKEELESRKKQINELQTHAKNVQDENFQLRGQLDLQCTAVISLESRLEEVRADNAKLKQKVEALEATHAMQENLDKRTVELNEQARVQELERATLAEEKKQHAETVEEDKVAHQAWMRDRDATLSELHGLQRENTKISIYSETVTEWISKCRNAEREKTDAQNGYNGLQCIRANLEKELKDSRHAVQDLERQNADLWLWMRSLDACWDVEIATNKFVSARTAACTFFLLRYL